MPAYLCFLFIKQIWVHLLVVLKLGLGSLTSQLDRASVCQNGSHFASPSNKWNGYFQTDKDSFTGCAEAAIQAALMNQEVTPG